MNPAPCLAPYSGLAAKRAEKLLNELVRTAALDPAEAVRDALDYFSSYNAKNRGGTEQGPAEKTLRTVVRLLIPEVMERRPDYGIKLATDAIRQGLVIEGIMPLVEYLATEGTPREESYARKLLIGVPETIENESHKKMVKNLITILLP